MGVKLPKIYLDSCIAIYLVEEHPNYSPQIESLVEGLSDADILVSDLTVMECLVGPLRKGDRSLEEKFNKWFDGVLVLPLSNIVFRDAGRLRADNSSLKTPDALHIATAVHHDCDEFWTNDTRLDKVAPNMVRNIL